ncbi:MAG: tetratricopeptide repeat protein, partial [Candidatus Odyssella sp.]|nr:tetratricopeptide repeat protein [Candidatus Odyssella sp.]
MAMRAFRLVLATCIAVVASLSFGADAWSQVTGRCASNCNLWVTGKRIPGSGAQAASAAECGNRCDANAACFAWMYWPPSSGSAGMHANQCELVGAQAAMGRPSELVISGLKSRPTAPPAAAAPPVGGRASTLVRGEVWASGYSPDTILSFNSPVTMQGCLTSCVANTNCRAWDWHPQNIGGPACRQFSLTPAKGEKSTYAPQNVRGMIVAAGAPAPAPPSAATPAGTPARTSIMTLGRNWMGHGESDFGHRSTKTPQECAAACVQESRCVAWSWLGAPLGTCVFKNSRFVDRTAWTNNPGGASGLIQTATRPPATSPPGTAAAPPGIPADPRQAYQAALAANQRNDPQSAIRILTAAINSGKLDADTRIKAHRVRGSSLFAMRRYADAKADYDIVIQANPRDADAYWGRAWINLELGQLDAALADADRSVALGPRSAHGFAMRAKIRAARGEFERAIADRTQAVVVTAAPKDKAQAHIERAETFRAAGRLADGIRDLDLALGLDPESARARLRRGTFHAEAGRYDDAHADFTALLVRDPKNASAAFGRGQTEAYRGRYADAAKDFARYVEVNPGSHLGQILRFLVRERAGEWELPDLARAAARLDLEKWPSPVIHFLLGNMREAELRDAARHEKAETQATQLCEVEFYVGYAALLAGDKAA